MTIDINKTYRTKAGYEVRVLTVEAPEPRPVVGIWWGGNLDGWVPDSWTQDGRNILGNTSSLDLVEVDDD